MYADTQVSSRLSLVVCVLIIYKVQNTKMYYTIVTVMCMCRVSEGLNTYCFTQCIYNLFSPTCINCTSVSLTYSAVCA